MTPDPLAGLLQFALQNGATKATTIPPQEIQVEARLAAYCRTPKCPNFGQSMSCPPYVSGPAGFRKKIQLSKDAVVFRIEVDGPSLHGEGRAEVMRVLHEVTAAIEGKAKELGFTKAEGFSGGSCKMSFCWDHETCRVIAEKGTCRYPDQARPSLSGFGVNVGELMKSAGWSTELFAPAGDESDQQPAWVAGLILLQ